jgi:outer membrane protein TolC
MRLIILLAGILALSPVAGPAQVMVLDSDAAAALALEHNLSILSRRLDLAVLERARSARWNAFVPALDARASLGQSYPESPQVAVSLQASLGLTAAAGYRLRDSLLAYQAGSLDLQTARRQLERDVRISFYGLLLSRRRTELAEQSIQTSQRRLEIARQNYERGRVSELELLNVQVALENLRPALAQARLDYQTGEMQLKDFLGLDPAREVALAGSLQPVGTSADLSELLALAAANPQILALQQQRLILENQRKLAAMEGFSPTLSLSYSYSPTQSWAAQSFAVALAVPLDPWLPRSQGRLRVREMDDSLARLELELAAARRQVEIRVRSIVLGLHKSRAGMEAGRKNVELAGKAYELAEREYQAGLADLLTVLEAQDGLQEALLGSLAESYNYQVGLLDLAFLLNTTPDRLVAEERSGL